MKKKVLSALLAVSALATLAACDKEKVVIDSISVDSTTVPSSILTTQVDDKLDDIVIKVKMSDGTVSEVNLTKEMLSAEDYAKLAEAGSHTVTITYEGKTVTLTIVVKAPEEEVKLTVTPGTTVQTREDSREEVYGVYTAAGELVSSHASLYSAINACVDEGDTEDYVAVAGDSTKLFINYDEYSEATKDMFWYYSGANQLLEYTPWCATYWNDLKDAEDVVSVFKAAENGTVTHYANSHQIINAHTNPEVGAGTTAVWNSCWELETNATVDMAAYSGITKSVYTIDLSEAKVTPSFEGSDATYAYVGFITADSYNVSHQGLRCDTATGNWYYYSGEVEYNVNNIELSDECYLTSTWDAEAGCWRPNGDVTMTMEELTLTDDEGDDYIVHRLTMEFDDNRKVVKDYEIATLTQCGTIRFTSGLDIVSDNTLVDYMNGAKFENLVITSAKATVLEEMQDVLVYGNVAVLATGEYDILNSNPETAARFHTIVYSPAFVTTDFSTAGKDVYNYSFDVPAAEKSLDTKVQAVVDAIAALPSAEEVAATDQAAVEAARALYEELKNEYQQALVTNYSKLQEVELAIGLTEPLIDVTLTPDFVNQDVTSDGNAFSVWTEAGAKIRTFNSEDPAKSSWIGNGWRYYIVVDAEGRICYAVYNPVSGYGTPNETSYYVDPHYNDYTKNPAVVLYEGFAPWVAGQQNHNYYDIIIPEGGFALTGHGSGANALADALSGGKITNCSEAALNSNTVFKNIRISYDSENNSVRVYELAEFTSQVTVNYVTHATGADELAVYVNGETIRSLTVDENGAYASHAWIDSIWRVYVVVDAQGRVCWLACNPDNGYGGPADNFLHHPVYSDYTKNPAIKLAEGFAPWVAGQTAHNLYEIVVPEGGYAIVAHGAAANALISAMTAGGLTSTDADAAVNMTSYYKGEITLSLDVENLLINVKVLKEAE